MVYSFWWAVRRILMISFSMLFSSVTSCPLIFCYSLFFSNIVTILFLLSCSQCRFDLTCVLVGGAGLRWNTGMCIWDIKFASCFTDSGNRRWFELVWAGMCIDRQGKLLYNLDLIIWQYLEYRSFTRGMLDFQGRRGQAKNQLCYSIWTPWVEGILKET